MKEVCQLGRPVLSLLFGSDFTVAYPAMVILVLGLFVNSISGSTGVFMNMTGRQKAFRNIAMTASGVNIILNLILTPNLGIYGAAISGMATIIFWNLYTLAYIKKKHGQTIGYLPLLVR